MPRTNNRQFQCESRKSALSSDDRCIGNHSKGRKNTNGQVLIDWYNRDKWFVATALSITRLDILQHGNNKEPTKQQIK